MDHGVVLCEIAEEIAPEFPEYPSELNFGKRRWRVKDFLREKSEAIEICIQGCESSKQIRQISYFHDLFKVRKLVPKS